MNSFHPLFKTMMLFAAIVLLILTESGCQRKTSEDISIFGRETDVTESVHHRLKAGIFDPATDPFVYQTVQIPFFVNLRAFFRSQVAMRFKRVPYQIARISWDRGSFRVRSDDQGRVVIHMDEETLFSHVQIATLKKFGHSIEFREINQHPYR